MTRLLAIVGPTAAGKSALAIEVARKLGGEVVNADSMQLYRGMDIGTAKPTVEEQDGVRHHLLDVWDVRETASVAEYQRMARNTIEDLLSKDVTPVLVGGSGLYVRAVIDLIDFPGTEPAVRQRLEAELAMLGAQAMHARLAQVDPKAADAILPSNGRRIVRALEVIEFTGGAFSATLPSPAAEPAYDAIQIGIDHPDLDVRIEERVQRMWDLGLVAEVRQLAGHGLREGLTASRALGYSQVLRHLDGELTEGEAREETMRATRRFARRQRSWFRRDPHIQWFEGSVDADRVTPFVRQAG